MQNMQNKLNRVDNCVIETRRVSGLYPIFDVFIRLDGEQRARNAGVYYMDDGRFTTNRKNEHVFRKTNSWGINANMLAMLDGLKTIVVLNEDTKESFTATYENFIKNSKEFTFKFAGYDKQRFLPLALWERSK